MLVTIILTVGRIYNILFDFIISLDVPHRIAYMMHGLVVCYQCANGTLIALVGHDHTLPGHLYLLWFSIFPRFNC